MSRFRLFPLKKGKYNIHVEHILQNTIRCTYRSDRDVLTLAGSIECRIQEGMVSLQL